MRLRARLLNVLVIAPVAVLTAGVLGPVSRAQAAVSAPTPIVVAIDPGHGGLPDTKNPGQPFDPGAIAASGLMEKDVTLDVARRLAALLRDDLVDAMLTRTDDRWVTIPDREQSAINAHAALFVSVHCNSFTDPTIGGALVLYPNQQSQPFAQTLSDALGHDLAASRVGDDGIQLRDNWWIHNPMPTATAEIAYLSNPDEAALMATSQFRQQVAAAIRVAIERYDPDIAARRAAIIAWRASHPESTSPPSSQPAAAVPPSTSNAAAAATPASPGAPFGTVLAWMIGIMVTAAVVRWREPAARALVVTGTIVVRMGSGTQLHHVAARRRRRKVRARQSVDTQQRWTRTYSVYDELSL